MWTSSRRFGAAHPSRSQQFGLAVALLACVGLAGCVPAESPPPAEAAGSGSVAPMPNSGELEAGTYLFNGFTVPFEITIPDGWTMKDGWLLIKAADDDHAAFLNFLNPTYVPTDACQWYGALIDVGPSVAGFTDALEAQGSTTTTSLTDVTLGDYRGVEFGLSVDGDLDIIDCNGVHICIHSESGNDCTRYYQSVARSETYRVLDLHGERAVMSVGEDAGVPAALTQEARATFDSIEFAPGE